MKQEALTWDQARHLALQESGWAEPLLDMLPRWYAYRDGVRIGYSIISEENAMEIFDADCVEKTYGDKTELETAMYILQKVGDRTKQIWRESMRARHEDLQSEVFDVCLEYATNDMKSSYENLNDKLDSVTELIRRVDAVRKL